MSVTNKHHKSFYIVKSKPPRCLKETNVLNLIGGMTTRALLQIYTQIKLNVLMFTILHTDNAG